MLQPQESELSIPNPHYVRPTTKEELQEERHYQNPIYVHNGHQISLTTVVCEPILERSVIYYQQYVTAIMLLLALALLGYLMYVQIDFIIEEKAYYASFNIPLILIGIVLFMFALKTITGCVFVMILGPLKHIRKNSTYFSAIKIPWPRGLSAPIVLVQIPVYKEDFDSVIRPTIESAQKALVCYKGTGRIIIFDDGLEVVDQEEKTKRQRYYCAHDIEFFARPGTGRTGLFKKASNMNYGLARLVEAGRIPDDAIILLLDADSRIPETCMNDVIPEFLTDPDLPYTQHYTEALKEQRRNYWEGLIAFFTRKIYFIGIGVCTALGDACPFMGHNAFIRWRHLKEVRLADGVYWAEDNVSEDFDLFLRLALDAKYGRYVMYTDVTGDGRVADGSGWEEGISLTFVDEVIKLKKFTYGSCEMCFHPIKQWFRKGIFNKMLIRFLMADQIKWYQKVNVCVYMSTYFAMAIAFYYIIAEAITSVFFPEFFDQFLVHSFDVMLTCIVIFGGVNLLGELVLQWRIKGLNGGMNLIKVLWNEIKWIPFLALFFNSILFYLTEVSVIYFWSIPVQGWGATVKEVTNVSFVQACKHTIVTFWKEYVLMSVLLGTYLYFVITRDLSMYGAWGVIGYTVAHMLGPIIFNPYVMTLSW